MAKQLIFDDEARRAVLKGVEQLARAVKVTMGPTSRKKNRRCLLVWAAD